MKKKINLNQKQIDYTLKRSARTRRLRLAVYCDGQMVVTAPAFMSLGYIEKIILQKASWIVNQIDHFKKFPGQALRRLTTKDYLKYKVPALLLAKERLEYYNKIYQIKIRRVSIKDQKTRWGSCSRLGNLNFNYKIALLPGELADYIVVHELCHLLEFNHSKRFWALVEKTVPNYVAIRKKLKQGNFKYAL